MTEPVHRESYEMRAPCKNCLDTRGISTTRGYIERRSGQDCVMCSACGRHQYNAPRHERGLAPVPVRSDGVSPGTRYLVQERAHRRCEFCGIGPDTEGVVFHVGHLVSQEECRNAGIPLRFSDYFDNLAWLCDSCNLGMGHRSLPLHDLLILAILRALAAERSS